MCNILITGASGYIGRALVKELSEMNLFLIDRVMDNSVGEKSKFSYKCDLNDVGNVFKDEIFDFSGIVVHLAAARSDDESTETYLADNVKATECLLKVLNPIKIKKFIHVGSVAAIDGEILSKKNKHPKTADDWYRLTKFKQQILIEDWAVRHNIPLIILAPSAVYDEEAKYNSTNIGRLDKIITWIKIAPKIDVLKSLTSMDLLIRSIIKSTVSDTIGKKGVPIKNPKKYLVLDKPTKTITDICRDKFKAKLVIKVPFLKQLLLFTAVLIKILRLSKNLPLTRNRILKIYKATDYRPILDYEDWNIE